MAKEKRKVSKFTQPGDFNIEDVKEIPEIQTAIKQIFIPILTKIESLKGTEKFCLNLNNEQVYCSFTSSTVYKKINKDKKYDMIRDKQHFRMFFKLNPYYKEEK